MGKKKMMPKFFTKMDLRTRTKLIFYFSKSPMGILHFARHSLDTLEKSGEVVMLCYVTLGVDSRGVRTKKKEKPKLLGTIVGRV
jgi:hypothetical protein